MRRVMTALVFAGAIALVVPWNSFAQRGGGGHGGGFSGGGHAGGFSGGHVGGFSGGHSFGGGPVGHGFGGGFAGPTGGFRGGGFSAPRSFPAPRTGLMGPGNSGVTRFAPGPRYYNGAGGQRSPFGQLPSVRPSPFYPGANRGWANQPLRNSGNNQWHGSQSSASNHGSSGGDHNGDHHHGDNDDDHDGHHHHYYYGRNYYSYWPYYYNWGYWPYYPYWGWDSGYDYSDPNYSGEPYYSSPAQSPEQYRQPYYDVQPEQDNTGRAAYQPEYAPPAISASPAVAVREPAVTIIYKDGHSEQVRNFVLTRSTLVEMDSASSGYSMQIPLELIDLPATERANRAAGVDFRVPVRNSLYPVPSGYE